MVMALSTHNIMFWTIHSHPNSEAARSPSHFEYAMPTLNAYIAMCLEFPVLVSELYLTGLECPLSVVSDNSCS